LNRAGGDAIALIGVEKLGDENRHELLETYQRAG
jgi:hypothetical protein